MSSFVPVHTFLIPVRMSVMDGPAQEWEAYRSARLHDAAAYGELACLDKLLSEGTDPDWVNPATGLTPLLIASMNGRAKCVLSLLRAGADIYAADPQGSTALELFIKLKTTRRSMSTVPSYHRVPQPALIPRDRTAFNTHRFKVCDKLCRSRNYKEALEYLEKADADCQRRSREQMLDYQGVVVVHPGSELGLVTLDS